MKRNMRRHAPLSRRQLASTTNRHHRVLIVAIDGTGTKRSFATCQHFAKDGAQ